VDRVISTFVFTEKILLYAGNFFLSSPLVLVAFGIIYLFYIDAYYIKGQSAGNFSFTLNVSDFAQNTYNKSNQHSWLDIPKISEHVPNHNSNLISNELGYFLAGLIEGNGLFDEKQLIIDFSPNDTSLAYYIKKQIGYGNVNKANAKYNLPVRYLCKHEKGLSIILSLINGKLLTNYKYDQLIKHNYAEKFNITILPARFNLALDNYWLAGFTQAKGSFLISVNKDESSVKLEYKINHTENLSLKLLHNILKNGMLSQNNTGLWCYKNTDYITAADLMNYFDKFNLFAEKYVSYLKFRKVYIFVSEGKHLQEKGLKRIISIASKG